MPPDSACYSSSALEKVLEHRFVAELSAALWLQGVTDFEVLRGEVDSHGYDLVVEANGIIRHIQLKALRQGGKRSEVTVSTRLARKPSGCVIWMVYDPGSLGLGPFRWFGEKPGERLRPLGAKVAHHTKGNAQGKKGERPGHRILKKSAFTEIATMAELVQVLFGAVRPPKVSAAGVDGIPGPVHGGAEEGRSSDPSDDTSGSGRLSCNGRARIEELAGTFAAARSHPSAPHPFASTVFPPRRDDNIVNGFPGTDYDGAVQDFWTTIDELQLASEPFDWPAWFEEIRSAGKDPIDSTLVTELNAADIRRYLTMLRRVERFTEGAWMEALNRGVFDALLRRILMLDDAAQLATRG